MSKESFGPAIARAIFPGIQGGPHEHTIAAKAVAFQEALDPAFAVYAREVLSNARILAKKLQEYGFRIVSGGTDNHLFLVDVFGSFGLSGKEAEIVLESIGISTNKNMIPFDSRKPMDPSGIRIGTPAVTTRGMKEPEMLLIARIISDAILHPNDTEYLSGLKEEIHELCRRFPLYR